MSFSIEDLVAMSRVTSVAPAPGGDWIAVEVQHLHASVGKYVSAIWRLDPATGEATALLSGPCQYKSPAFRGDGALVFLSNRPAAGDPDGDPEKPPADDARTPVGALDVSSAGAEPQMLTDEPLGVSSVAVASGSSRFVVVAPLLPGVAHEAQRSTAEDRKKHGPSALHYTGPRRARYWDHWIGEAEPHLVAFDPGGARTDLTPTPGGAYREVGLDLSEDGATLVATHRQPSDLRLEEVRLQAFDLATGRPRWIVDEPRLLLGMPRIAPDGSRVAFVRTPIPTDGCIHDDLCVAELDGSGLRQVAAGWDRWPQPHAWSADGSQLLATADDGGHKRLVTISVASGAVAPLTETGSVSCVRRTGSGTIVGVFDRISRPPEVFVLEGESLRVVSDFAKAPDFGTSSVVESITVEGAGGDPVQAWLVLPRDAKGPLPTVFWIHGGPIGAWNDGWHWRWCPQALVAQGYAMVLPNPRGSTGFGQAFIDGIWGNQWGAACFDDLMALADHLAADPRFDASRTAAMGGSFGGYMTNWIGGQTDRFRCLITHASLYHLSAFYGTTDTPPFWQLQMGGAPWDDQGAFDRYSPHRHVTNWRSPTLIIHGDKDYRVPITEALSLYEALQGQGVHAELLVFPDENHWILKPRNIGVWYERVLAFLREQGVAP